MTLFNAALLRIPKDFVYDACPPLELPPYLDGDIEVFEFNENSMHGTHWFFKMLDELQKEYDDAGGGPAEGFIHNKTCLLKAWHEHRMFGLKMARTESVFTHHPQELYESVPGVYPYIWTNYTAATSNVQCALPLFCVLQNPRHPHAGSTENAIEYLWVAERARGVGLGRRMAREMCCSTVLSPMWSSVAFWNKLGYQLPPPRTREIV